MSDRGLPYESEQLSSWEAAKANMEQMTISHSDSSPDPEDRGTAVAREALAWYMKIRKTIRIPVPIEDLAMLLGYRIILLTTVPEEFSGLISTKEKLIGINRNHHLHRRRFSIGHEIGHLLLNHPPEIECSAQQIVSKNREADACASELLMPEELLLRMTLRFHRPDHLALAFEVSPEAMRRRLDRLAREFA